MHELAGSPVTAADVASIDLTLNIVHDLLLLGEELCRAAMDEHMLADLLTLLGKLQDPRNGRSMFICITTLLKANLIAVAAWEAVSAHPAFTPWIGALQSLSRASPHDSPLTEALEVIEQHKTRAQLNAENV